jgi:hypothetical protein
LELADIDHDGDLDGFGITGRWGENDDRVHENVVFENIDGILGAKQVTGRSAFEDNISSADLNGDGRVDLLVRTFNGVAWYDAFAGQPNLVTSDEDDVLSSNIQIVDLDMDGDRDLFAYRFNPVGQQEIIWFENLDGLGSFGPALRIGTPLSSPVAYLDFSIAHVADSEGDGDNDVFVVQVNRDITLLEHRVTGDSNNDGVFDSSDLVAVLAQGQYEDGMYRNSTFDSGDWNRDREFDTKDIVFAFQAGTYAQAVGLEQIAGALAAEQLVGRRRAGA